MLVNLHFQKWSKVTGRLRQDYFYKMYKIYFSLARTVYISISRLWDKNSFEKLCLGPGSWRC